MLYCFFTFQYVLDVNTGRKKIVIALKQTYKKLTV